jgi:hypothetical protein
MVQETMSLRAAQRETVRKGARIGGWLHGLAERRTEGRTSPRAQAVSAL